MISGLIGELIECDKFNNKKNNREIDEENDIYPPPIITSQPSKKRETMEEKLLYASMYRKTSRLRQLLLECGSIILENPIDRRSDTYLHLILDANPPTNMHYHNNVELGDDMLFIFLQTVSPENLQKLFQKIADNDKFMKSLFKTVKDRPHMLLALWDYGFIYNPDKIKDYDGVEYVKLFLKRNHSEPKIGVRRYFSLIKERCPLSCSIFSQPVILTDGIAYEYSWIKKYLLEKDKSPITNQILSCVDGATYNVEYINGEPKFKDVYKSIKSIYIPEQNRFKHFELCDMQYALQ